MSLPYHHKQIKTKKVDKTCFVALSLHIDKFQFHDMQVECEMHNIDIEDE